MSPTSIAADEPSVNVVLNTSEVPHLAQWGQSAKSLIVRWHPRLGNLLANPKAKLPQTVHLKIAKSEQGVGGTSGTKITISSHWIEKHPDDLGLVLHELVHVIQAYPKGDPWWITEGIADYLRWAIYEGKQQTWFPRPKEKHGYRKGYRVAAGFFLWLEADAAPGIVKKLNSLMKKGEYSPEIFKKETGRTLDQLWEAYVGLK